MLKLLQAVETHDSVYIANPWDSTVLCTSHSYIWSTSSIDYLPPLRHRERISSKDPLACVYAFNVTCVIALKALFGVNVCPDCPNCDCRNAFGSVSSTSGGCFGRVEAYFGSKECQKSGTCPSLTLFKHANTSCPHGFVLKKGSTRLRRRHLIIPMGICVINDIFWIIIMKMIMNAIMSWRVLMRFISK